MTVPITIANRHLQLTFATVSGALVGMKNLTVGGEYLRRQPAALKYVLAVVARTPAGEFIMLLPPETASVHGAAEDGSAQRATIH